MSPRFFWIALPLLGGLLLALILPAFDFDLRCADCWALHRHRHHAERPASTYLKAIAAAQADFRANDRDGDGVNQFWRADIAGLYSLAPGGGPAIRLIERRLALADPRPVYEIGAEGERAPLKGYWFRAIRCPGEKTIDGSTQFAAVAYPADYPQSGRYTFILNEENTIYRADLGHGRGIETFPTEEDLKKSWSKID
jgi:hypothetical protein